MRPEDSMTVTTKVGLLGVTPCSLVRDVIACEKVLTLFSGCDIFSSLKLQASSSYKTFVPTYTASQAEDNNLKS